MQTNPGLAESDYNQSNPIIQFYNNKLKNNNNIFSITEFNSLDKLISAQDSDGLEIFKYFWSDQSSVDFNCNDLLKGTKVPLITNTKDKTFSRANNNKPQSAGKYYLHICAKDILGNESSAIALYQLKNNQEKDNDGISQDKKYPNCTNARESWCDSQNGLLQGYVSPCCQGNNLVRCQENNSNSYSIQTIESNSSSCQ